MYDSSWRAVLEASRGDPEFRERLERDPKAVLASMGVDTGRGEVRVVEDTAEVRHVVIPDNPNAALSDKALEPVAGGACRSYYDRMAGCYWVS